YSETFYPLNSFGWSPLHALETARYHYVDAPQPELYDLAADPEEKNNLVASQGATASVLKEKLQLLLQRNPYKPPEGGNANLNPDYEQAMTGLSRALLYQNKDEEAKQWARNALKYNPENYRAWYQLGFIETKTDKPAAIADYEKAVAIQGNFAPLRRDLGLLYFQQQNYAEAVKHLTKAAELGMKEAQLWNVLGIAYSHSNRLAKAVESYKRALKLDPVLAEAHLNLAYAYETLQHPVVARKEYETACRLQTNFCQYVPEDQQ